MEKIYLNISDVLKRENMSIYKLSKITGIKYDIIKKYCDNEMCRIDLFIISKICNALNCKINDIIKSDYSLNKE